MLIYLLSTFICTDWNLFVSCFLIQLHKVFAEFKPKHSTILANWAEQRRRLFIYFGHSGLLLVLRLFTVCRNAKPQTQLNRTSPPLPPWSGHKALRGPPLVTKPTFHPFNQPTKHAKQSRPARKGRGGNKSKESGLELPACGKVKPKIL